MDSAPILILQMQRMGDLILTFPLIIDLSQTWPNTPIWLVAEEIFFTPLLSLAPHVTFFSPHHLPKLVHHPFSLIINVSSRPEAALFAGQAKADCILGERTTSTQREVRGFWHLYRYALTQNNRHNTFHWADLNRLDLVSSVAAIKKRGHTLRPPVLSSKRIGFVLGASTIHKHPDSHFWFTLARILLKQGLYPFFFGGKNEEAMGDSIARRLGLPKANLAGKLSLAQVATWFKTLDLCISPDTGPMHLCDWIGTPVLNLSMGDVRAYETGPYSKGQWILTPRISCAGCWQCQNNNFRCKQHFTPGNVAKTLLALLRASPLHHPHGLTLSCSARENALATIVPNPARDSLPTLLDGLWRKLFLGFFDPSFLSPQDIHKTLTALGQQYPRLLDHMQQSLASYAKQLMAARYHGSTRSSLASIPPSLRLFASFIDLYLDNAQETPKAWEQVFVWLAQTKLFFGHPKASI
ncbi:MAG: glycosyltransferase family 9 protein [Desulfovibrio sp.]|nr:glycosyltransferase family 9 protein [Desulfovibrio sp.]